MSIEPRNGYVTLTTLVSALLGLGISLGGLCIGTIKLSQSDIRQQIDEHQRRLNDDEAKIVPWAVHQEKWNAQAAQDARLQAEIDETNKRIGDAYSLGDALKHMQDQLDKIRDGKEKQ